MRVYMFVRVCVYVIDSGAEDGQAHAHGTVKERLRWGVRAVAFLLQVPLETVKCHSVCCLLFAAAIS